MTSTLVRPLVLSVLATLPFAGCAGSTADLQYANEAIDSTESADSEGALIVPATDSASAEMPPEMAAATAALKAGTYFQPPGCVTANAEARTVTYSLSDCTGPHGLVHVTGTVIATYAAGIAGLVAHFSSSGLIVNRATLDLDANVVYTDTDGVKRAVVGTQSLGIGARGTSFTHSGNYNMTWDSSCLSLDGEWSTRADGLRWATNVTGFHSCTGGCPSSGGEVSYQGGVTGVAVTVTFDGSSTASWTSTRGRSGTLSLSCR